MKKLKHSDLMKLYIEGEEADKGIFAEQRSNLMLVAGNHYSKKNNRFFDRVREDKNIPQEQKIRLTKNHIQRICKIYENNILSYAPAVKVKANNESEIQDQKAAELNDSVWKSLKDRHKIKDRTREFCQDFIRIGEAAVKIYWDETKGRFLGYEQAVDPETGEPQFEMMEQVIPASIDPETGEETPASTQMVPDQSKPVQDLEKPRFSGDLVFERIFTFNMFRAKEAKSMDESWFLGIRKMVDVSELKARIGDDEEKLKLVTATKDETFLVFDGNNTGHSRETADQCLVREVYIKPCLVYPKGYYYIYTENGILWEGELPFGVFPIVYVGFDEVPTNARCHSIIKHLRPLQAEINRCSSLVAETQITLGADKIFYSVGNKMQNGGSLPGVRGVQISGGPPTILPGRTGDQYLPHIQQQIEEMYQIANVKEDLEEKPSQVDPYTMLFMSMDQRKKYVLYSSKFMGFLKEMCAVALTLYREYATDDQIEPMIGRSEMVNIAELKNTTPLMYQIALEEGTEDMESKLGRQLVFNQIIQYAGSSLDKEMLGKLIRTAPYGNNELGTEDMTLDYDNATNMILSLDRGKMMQPNPKDNADYMMKRLVARMRKADFIMLPPQIQQMYEQVYQMYVEIEAEQQRKIQEAAMGYIPMQGMAVVCDIYVPDPNNKSKQQRARIPYDSLVWLLKRLEEQGANQEMIDRQQKSAVADVAAQMQRNPQQMSQQLPQQGGVMDSPVQPQLQQI